MSYLDRVLQPDETVRYRSKVHWLIYWPAVLFLLVVIAGFVGSYKYPNSQIVMAAVMLVGAVGFFIFWVRGFIKRWTTEIAVTDRRVIFKEGLVARRTIEMNMDKIESVDVDQSVWGRLFDYGSVVIRGTGSSMEPLKQITSPIQFRNHVLVR